MTFNELLQFYCIFVQKQSANMPKNHANLRLTPTRCGVSLTFFLLGYYTSPLVVTRCEPIERAMLLCHTTLLRYIARLSYNCSISQATASNY